MATFLTGIPAETIKGSGGIMEVYITELANITGTTSVSNGTAVFHSGANMWKQYVLGKQAGSDFTSTLTGNIANGTNVYEQVLKIVFKRTQVSKRNELKVLAQSELVCVINDNCAPTGSTADCRIGNLYIIGLPVCTNTGGADVTSGVISTGAQLGDANNMTVTISVQETMPPLAVAPADYLKIKAGSAF